MRFVVECELHSDLGETARDEVQKALSALGGVANLRVTPMPTYALNIEINAASHPNPSATE